MPLINLTNSRNKETENGRNARAPFALRNDDRCVLLCPLSIRQHFSTMFAFNGIPLNGFCTIRTGLCSVAHFYKFSVRYFLINS